ncbi:hypothetical protein Tco_1082895 [Tanacetum coccineum]|uniref:Uncharacterized protein n=1 Tax=Tanacetum coccineum TaxID=301880 RepID=A0ABQ5I363_9ASTR
MGHSTKHRSLGFSGISFTFSGSDPTYEDEDNNIGDSTGGSVSLGGVVWWPPLCLSSLGSCLEDTSYLIGGELDILDDHFSE